MQEHIKGIIIILAKVENKISEGSHQQTERKGTGYNN